MKLITILQSLREQPRPLTDEEDLYLSHLSDQMRRAESDGARWRILEGEGMNQTSDFKFDEDVAATLNLIRRAGMN